MRILAVVQARVGSTRLPGKVLKPILGRTILEHVIRAAPEPRVVVCPGRDWAIRDICSELHVDCVMATGPRDVLGEYINAHRKMRRLHGLPLPYVLRITADCPALTLDLVDRFLDVCEADEQTIWTNRPLDPDGLDLELFPIAALAAAHEKATEDYDREHVTPYLYNTLQTKRVRVSSMDPRVKVSVDTEEDYKRVKALMEGAVHYG